MAYLFAALRGEYAALWRQMIADDRRSGEFLTTVRRMNAGMASYRAVEEITGVPAAVVAVIHEREGAGNFTTHLHNGDPLRERTVHVPAGRPLAGSPPFTWTESAIDALRYEGLDRVADDGGWSVERACFALERYNGFGYRNHGMRSPYLWGGTNQQQPGKYVADGRFDPGVLDRQPGCMPLLQKLWSLDPALRLPMADDLGLPRPTPPLVPPRLRPPPPRPVCRD
jgi:lysozyme family protein